MGVWPHTHKSSSNYISERKKRNISCASNIVASLIHFFDFKRTLSSDKMKQSHTQYNICCANLRRTISIHYYAVVHFFYFERCAYHVNLLSLEWTKTEVQLQKNDMYQQLYWAIQTQCDSIPFKSAFATIW